MDPITITLPGWNQISSYLCPPDSTDDVIVFPFNSSSQKFSRTVDSTKVAQDKATLDDINSVLTIFETVLSRFDSTRKYLPTLIFSILIPYMLFVNNYYLYVTSLVDSLRFFATVFVFIVVSYSIFKRMRQAGRTKVDLQRMLDMVRPAYAKRGLTWHFTERFFCSWLELRKGSPTSEQNSAVSVEVPSDNSQESFIHQQGSSERVLEDLNDEENLLVCAGKNLTGPDFSPPVQWRYIIYFIIFAYIAIPVMNHQYYVAFRYHSYYYDY